MARIVLEHDDLDGTIEREEHTLPAWEAQGWRRTVTTPSASGSDTDATPQPAGGRKPRPATES